MKTPRRETRGRPRKPTPPVPRREPRDEATPTVEAIIQGAERVLERDGIAGLTTNRIAERAGVSIGSLYHYYPNRDAIVAALYRRYMAAFAGILPGVLASSAGVPLRQLAERIADAVVDRYQTQPKVHRLLWQLRSEAASHDELDRQLDGMAAVAANFLASRGLAAKVDVAALAFVLVNAIDGAANAIANRPDRIDARTGARIAAAMVAAYVETLERPDPR